MSLQHTINVGRAVQTIEVLGLLDVDTIVPFADAFTSSSCFIVDEGNDLFGCFDVLAGDCIVINLSTDEYCVTIYLATVEVPLMSG